MNGVEKTVNPTIRYENVNIEVIKDELIKHVEGRTIEIYLTNVFSYEENSLEEIIEKIKSDKVHAHIDKDPIFESTIFNDENSKAYFICFSSENSYRLICQDDSNLLLLDTKFSKHLSNELLKIIDRIFDFGYDDISKKDIYCKIEEIYGIEVEQNEDIVSAVELVFEKIIHGKIFTDKHAPALRNLMLVFSRIMSSKKIEGLLLSQVDDNKSTIISILCEIKRPDVNEYILKDSVLVKLFDDCVNKNNRKVVEGLLYEKRKGQGGSYYVIDNEHLEEIFLSQITDGGDLIQFFFNIKRAGNHVIDADCLGRIMENVITTEQEILDDLIKLKKESNRGGDLIEDVIYNLVDKCLSDEEKTNCFIKKIFLSEKISSNMRSDLEEYLIDKYSEGSIEIHFLLNHGIINEDKLKKFLKRTLKNKVLTLEESLKHVEKLVHIKSECNYLIKEDYMHKIFNTYSMRGSRREIEILSFIRRDMEYLIKSNCISQSFFIAVERNNKEIVDYLMRIKRPVSEKESRNLITYRELEKVNNSDADQEIKKLIVDYINYCLNKKEIISEKYLNVDKIKKKNNVDWNWKDIVDYFNGGANKKYRIEEIDLTLPIVNKKDGRRLLHIAARNGNAKHVKLLIGNRVPVDSQCAFKM
ncbi:MAG: hypothetical protein AB2993_07645 (plasmid) [Candidatus Symbiodolus clandestinus]